MSGCNIRTISSFNELDSIKSHWLELESKDKQSSVFQSWQWNRTWCEQVLVKNSSACLHVQVVEDGEGAVVAILPFFITALVGPLLKITQFLGHRMSVRNNILIADHDNQALVDEVIKLMLGSLGRNNLLHLRHLPGDSLFTKTLHNKKLAKPQCKNLYIGSDLAVTDQLTRLGKASQKTLRKHRRRLEKNYDCKITVSSSETVAKAFDDWFYLHEQRFKSKNRQSVITSDNLKFLKTAVLSLAAEDNVEILSLHADDKVVGSQVLVNDGVRCFTYQCGFDPEFARYSPLKILMVETLRRAFDELNCEVVDFGPGYEPYKYEWSPDVGLNYSCCVGGKGIYIKTLAGLYRYAFHKRLPAI